MQSVCTQEYRSVVTMDTPEQHVNADKRPSTGSAREAAHGTRAADRALKSRKAHPLCVVDGDGTTTPAGKTSVKLRTR